MELELQNNKVERLLDAANRYFDTSEFTHVEECLKEALTLNPDNFLTLFQLSKLYYTKKEYELAEFYLLKTVRVKPNIAGIFSVLGIVQKELGKFDEAEQSYLKAIQLNPGFDEAYYNLGILLYNKKQLTRSIHYFNKAIDLNSNLYLAYYNMGNIYRELEKYDEAIQSYTSAIQIKNNFSDAYYNLGVVTEQLFDHQKALQFYDLALIHDKNHVTSHWNRAIILLLLQNYEEGFKEYEWRKKKNDYPKRMFSKPELSGENIKGKTVFVYDDQGLGDTIQFARYLLKLKELGANVFLECDKNLITLFNGFFAVDRLIEKSNKHEPEIDYDYHISLLSLPYYFKTSYQTVPVEAPYLYSDKMLTERWNRIIGKTNKVKVGLVWAGNPHHTRDKHRSINFSAFEKLLSREEVQFYSLQKYLDDNANLVLKNSNGIAKLEIESFADTAAIIENLDLVISVDTSVAHLAGAMGKPVWNLIYYYPDWRWGLESSTTLWYPSMKLFRQPNPFNWQSVLEDVEKELKIFVRQKKKE
ncbi:MAG: tetratricopeptide repeat protein [Ignavibacteriaceae bacterium]